MITAQQGKTFFSKLCGLEVLKQNILAKSCLNLFDFGCFSLTYMLHSILPFEQQCYCRAQTQLTITEMGTSEEKENSARKLYIKEKVGVSRQNFLAPPSRSLQAYQKTLSALSAASLLLISFLRLSTQDLIVIL